MHNQINKYHKMEYNNPFSVEQGAVCLSLQPPTHSYFTSRALSLALLQYMQKFFEADTKKSIRQVNKDWKYVICSCIRRVSGRLYPHVFAYIPGERQESCLRFQERLSKLSCIGKTCLSISIPCFRQISIEWKKSYHFLTQFKDFTRLEHVSLSDITNFELEHLAPHFTTLRSLKLSFSPIDTGLHSLRNLTNLESLEINSCRITDSGLNAITGLTSLKNLSIKHCGKFITFSGIARLKHLPIQNLNLEGFAWRLIGENTNQPLNAKDFVGFTALRTLTFCLCKIENIEALMQISTLETLSFDMCLTHKNEDFRFYLLDRILKRKFKVITSEQNTCQKPGSVLFIETSLFQVMSEFNLHPVLLLNRQTF